MTTEGRVCLIVDHGIALVQLSQQFTEDAHPATRAMITPIAEISEVVIDEIPKRPGFDQPVDKQAWAFQTRAHRTFHLEGIVGKMRRAARQLSRWSS